MGPPFFAFSGQGAFKPGFGRGLLGNGTFRRSFEEVSHWAGRDLGARAWGPKAALTVRNSADLQLTHFALAWALAHAVAERTGPPALCLGHSLGEICALVFSGALGLREGTDLVHRRGTCMEEARQGVPQDLLIVHSGDERLLEDVIQQTCMGTVFISNLNTSTQTLVAGKLDALRDFAAALERHGIASRFLGTGMGFHSPLMATAAEALDPIIDGLEIRRPATAFFCVAADRCLWEPEIIRTRLRAHLLGKVHWRRAMATVLALCPGDGNPAICEIGAAKVLRGMHLSEHGIAGTGAFEFSHCLDHLA